MKKQYESKGEYVLNTKVRRLSIRWKILVPTTLLIIAMGLAIGINAYTSLKAGMIQLGVEEAQMAAAIAVSSVDGDSLSHVGSGFEKMEEYQTNLTALRKTQKVCGIAYLYTLHADNNSLCYGIDTDSTGSQKHPGDAFDDGTYEEFFKRIWRTGVCAGLYR